LCGRKPAQFVKKNKDKIGLWPSGFLSVLSGFSLANLALKAFAFSLAAETCYKTGECEMTVSVFVGISVDGFMARSDGSLDFLEAGGGEPHGYDEFIATVDALVIGRNTFETVLAFPEWPYGDKRVVVLSSRPLDFSSVRAGRVEQMSDSPAEIVAKLAATGAHRLYVDGGITIQRFLRAGLVQRLVVTRVPVLIGQGIPLFGALSHDLRLRHVATQQYAGGLVKSEYEVVNQM